MRNRTLLRQVCKDEVDPIECFLIAIAVSFYLLRLLHLRADFPNRSPWNDWAKMTDEGWYGGAALHKYVWGHWYLRDSFNPAVAMPIWSLMLAGWFRAVGAEMVSARILCMLLYGASLVLLYKTTKTVRFRRLGSLAILLVAVNPFCYAFDRLAILEPVTVFWFMAALWIATKAKRGSLILSVSLGLILAMLVLTKVTGIVLVPAVFYLVLAEWGWPGFRGDGVKAWQSMALSVAAFLIVWIGYVHLVLRSQYSRDYQFLFAINDYRVHLSIVPQMTWVTIRDGAWVNPILFWSAGVVMVMSVLWLRELWRIPLFGASVIAVVGHLAYIGYHTNFQPRYYLVIAIPVALIDAFGIALLWERRETDISFSAQRRFAAVLAVLIAGSAIGMSMQTIWYVLHPEYSFWNAAQGIASIMRQDDRENQVLLSDSGDDLSLWTGVPAVCESYTPSGLDIMLQRYKPQWYAAWLGWEDVAIRRIGKRYRIKEVARYQVFDDPKRQTLILYKLLPR